jgi:hypothetical protein
MHAVKGWSQHSAGLSLHPGLVVGAARTGDPPLLTGVAGCRRQGDAELRGQQPQVLLILTVPFEFQMAAHPKLGGHAPHSFAGNHPCAGQPAGGIGTPGVLATPVSVCVELDKMEVHPTSPLIA